jgi:hypothetical protein
MIETVAVIAIVGCVGSGLGIIYSIAKVIYSSKCNKIKLHKLKCCFGLCECQGDCTRNVNIEPTINQIENN